MHIWIRFGPTSMPCQAVQVCFHWSYVFAMNFSYWKAGQLASICCHIWAKYHSAFFVKNVFSSMNSWQPCLLCRKSYTSFSYFNITMQNKRNWTQAFFSVVILQVNFNHLILIDSIPQMQLCRWLSTSIL